MQALIQLLKRRPSRMVRPWALSAPIVVLMLSLPLLRPLRQPAMECIADDEQSRLATVQALVEHHTLAIDQSLFAQTTCEKIRVAGRLYSSQPPVFAALLSGPYWVMHHAGLTFEHNPLWVMFLLTLIGVTVPVALAAGLIYKMGRLFELRRPMRAALALGVVLGSGLISYSTVLNAHAPAAALLLAAAACFFHVGLIHDPRKAAGWLSLAGVCAALSAAIDPPAIIFTLLLAPVAASFRWPAGARAVAVCFYLLGTMAPIALHLTLNEPITGDFIPASLLPGAQPLARLAPPPITPADEEEDDAGPLHSVWRIAARVVAALAGEHGILTHFPVMLLGLIGVTTVMHRHWPASTKMLAGVTIGGGAAILLLFSLSRIDWGNAMFATRWFILFLPLGLFWSGAWLRRRHHRATWAVAAALLAFSTAVSLIGATGPIPREGFDRYTAAGAVLNLIHPPAPAAVGPILARQ